MRRVGYLVSQYPAVSHTFIRREIAALRVRGLEIHSFSLRRPGSELRSADDLEEWARTDYLLPVEVAALLAAHGWALLRSPRRWLGTLAAAFEHRLPGGREALWACFRFAEAILLAHRLHRRGIAHLHVHFANSGAHVGLLAARQLGIPFSLTLHGSADFDAPSAALLPGKIAAASFVACVSHFSRSRALLRSDPEHWSKIFVSHCGVELERLPRRRAPREGARLRLLTVGRLVPEKGQLGLLEAFAGALKQGADLELLILGEGPERARLERRIDSPDLRGRCRLPGAASEQEVLAAMAEADLFVLPSLAEGLPVVLMEALGLGLPVLAPRLAGIPELVEDGHSGLLFHPANWHHLEDRLMRLISDPDLRTRLGREGRRRVEHEFRIERAVEPLRQRLLHDD